jgi:hypothetical protein
MCLQLLPVRTKGTSCAPRPFVCSSFDVSDATTSARPYKRAQPASYAFESLAGEAKKGWRNGEIVAELIAVLDGSGHDED